MRGLLNVLFGVAEEWSVIMGACIDIVQMRTR